MKASYVVAPIALDDIDDAAAFVAESDPNAARRLIDDLYDSFQRIADHPGIGHARTDLTLLPVFFWTASQRRYAVIYRKTMPVEIVRVLAWKRDVPRLLLA